MGGKTKRGVEDSLKMITGLKDYSPLEWRKEWIATFQVEAEEEGTIEVMNTMKVLDRIEGMRTEVREEAEAIFEGKVGVVKVGASSVSIMKKKISTEKKDCSEISKSKENNVLNNKKCRRNTQKYNKKIKNKAIKSR